MGVAIVQNQHHNNSVLRPFAFDRSVVRSKVSDPGSVLATTLPGSRTYLSRWRKVSCKVLVIRVLKFGLHKQCQTFTKLLDMLSAAGA
jgi:hypothetical protein